MTGSPYTCNSMLACLSVGPPVGMSVSWIVCLVICISLGVESFIFMSLSREAFPPSARNSSRNFTYNAIVMKADMTS